jgi:hypothetical protein
MGMGVTGTCWQRQQGWSRLRVVAGTFCVVENIGRIGHLELRWMTLRIMAFFDDLRCKAFQDMGPATVGFRVYPLVSKRLGQQIPARVAERVRKGINMCRMCI